VLPGAEAVGVGAAGPVGELLRPGCAAAGDRLPPFRP
jgi:hypothetical protein